MHNYLMNFNPVILQIYDLARQFEAQITAHPQFFDEGKRKNDFSVPKPPVSCVSVRYEHLKKQLAMVQAEEIRYFETQLTSKV